MSNEFIGLLADLVDGAAFSGIPFTRLAAAGIAHVLDKQSDKDAQPNLDPKTLEGRINLALSAGDFEQAVRQVQDSDLPYYKKDQVIEEIGRIKEKMIDAYKDEARQREERNARLRTLVRQNEYKQAIGFVEDMKLPKEERKKMISALKEHRKRRPSQQAFAEAVCAGRYDEALSLLDEVSGWPDQNKTVFRMLIAEIQRIHGLDDREYGRAIGQVGHLDISRAERREKIRMIEAARKEKPLKDSMIQAIHQRDFEDARRIVHSLEEYPDDLKNAFKVFFNELEWITP